MMDPIEKKPKESWVQGPHAIPHPVCIMRPHDIPHPVCVIGPHDIANVLGPHRKKRPNFTNRPIEKKSNSTPRPTLWPEYKIS